MSCENNKAADTNATGLSVTKSEMPATADTQWLQLEPNEVSNFSANIEKTARDPISQDRQRRKGAITSLAAAPQFTSDLTLDTMFYFIEGYIFSMMKGLQPDSYTVDSVTAASNTYTVEAGGAVLVAGSLVKGDGFINPENNGLKTVSAGTATTVVVNETLVDEAASPTQRLYYVGVRGASGDLVIDAQGNLTSTALDLTTLGLNVGQYVQVGGADTANRFDNAYGKARITTISANEITFDSRDTAWTPDTGAGKEVDLIFGGFVRNVPVGDVDFLKQFYHMEAFYNTDPQLYEYADCCLANTMTINNALQDKATLDLGFVGKDLTPPTDTPRIGERLKQVNTAAYSTTADIARVRVSGLDDSGVTTFLKDTNVSMNNNVAAEYVLGQLEAEFMNFGNFEVDVETSVLFTDATVLNAIRNNTSFGLSIGYKNTDGGFVMDWPSGTFGDGAKNLTRNQKLTISSPFAAEISDTFGYTMSYSHFWYLP